MKQFNQGRCIHGYPPVGEGTRRLGLYLIGAGYEAIKPGEPYPLPSHPELYAFTWQRGRTLPEYQLVHISAGVGEFESEATGHIKLEAGMVMLLMPDVWHRYRPDPSTGWESHWISFDGELPHLWGNARVIRPETAVWSPDPTLDLSNRYREIINLVVNQPEHVSTATTSLALGLLTMVLGDRLALQEQTDTTLNPLLTREVNDPMVAKALKMIWTHSHRGLSVPKIAAGINANRRTLERRFAQARGRSVLSEIIDCRITRAKRLLIETHLPIKRVAYGVGFSSPTHFAVSFRREVGMTPATFRKRFRKRPSR